MSTAKENLRALEDALIAVIRDERIALQLRAALKTGAFEQTQSALMALRNKQGEYPYPYPLVSWETKRT